MGIRSFFRRWISRDKDTDPESVGPRGVKRYESRASRLLANPEKTALLLDSAEEKGEHSSSLEAIWDEVLVLIRMIRAYADGRYRKVRWATVLTATAAVVYLVVPTDFIPDFFIGMGMLDDAAVLAWTLRSIKASLDEFRAWESTAK